MTGPTPATIPVSDPSAASEARRYGLAVVEAVTLREHKDREWWARWNEQPPFGLSEGPLDALIRAVARDAVRYAREAVEGT